MESSKADHRHCNHRSAKADDVFWLGDAANGDTKLRVHRPCGRGFHEDSIYSGIRSTLDRLAEVLIGRSVAQFQNPFFDLGKHALGGCSMAEHPSHGVVDEYRRMFDASRACAVYPGLYVTDAAIILTSLGINPP